MGFSGIVASRGRVVKVDRQSAVKLWDGSTGRSHTLTVHADEGIITEKTVCSLKSTLGIFLVRVCRALTFEDFC